MKDYRKDILARLLEKYERSKLYAVHKRAGTLVDPGERGGKPDGCGGREGEAVADGARDSHDDRSAGARKIALKYSREEFPDYWDESTADKRQAVNLATAALESQGIIRVQRARWDRETVEKVYLCLEKLDDAYDIAGRYPRKKKEAFMEKLVLKWLRRWQEELENAERRLSPPGSASANSTRVPGSPHDPNFPPVNRLFCLRTGVAFLREFEARLRDCLSLPCSFSLDDAERLEDVCKAIDSLSGLTSETPARVFSVRAFGDSKRLEAISPRLIRVFCEFGDLGLLGIDEGDFQSSADLNDVLWAELGIVKNPGHVFVSGPLKLRVDEHIVDLGGFTPDIGLPEKMVRDSEIVGVDASTVITVENLTPFYMLAQALCEDREQREKYLLVYLGGYHNKSRREFLRKIYESYLRNGRHPRFLHWGDIDLGGFRIYEHLTRRTAIPIQPLLMDKDTYLAYSARGRPVSRGYRKQLEALLVNPRYQMFYPVMSTILERGTVVEQESVDVEEVLKRCRERM